MRFSAVIALNDLEAQARQSIAPLKSAAKHRPVQASMSTAQPAGNKKLRVL
jgi:hypothetical protein